MIDFNAKLGNFPYRPVKGVQALLNAMDAHAVDRAVVSSLSSAFFLNPQDGNEELVRLIEPHRDRLIPFAVLKPNFTAWEDDLERCLDEFRMAGVVLYPNYHRYHLNGGLLDPLMHEAAQRSFPVCVQAWLEDPRRQFGREIIAPVEAAEIGDLARAYPEATVVGLGVRIGQPAQIGDPLPDNFYFDTSNYERMNELEDWVGQSGPEKMLFGSNFPLYNYLANVDKLAKADLKPEDKDTIAGETARRILGI